MCNVVVAYLCVRLLCVSVCGSQSFWVLCVSDRVLCVFVSTHNSTSCAVTCY